MKIFRLVILILGITVFHFSSLNAQKNQRYVLTGRVTDTSGAPLAGASVYIPDIRRGSVTDSAGHYRVDGIPAGTYLVEVAFVGYRTVTRNIYFNQDKVQDFSTGISVTEENEIVITGTSKATSVKRNPVPIVSISRQFLQQNLNTNVIDAIARVPGISEVTTGPNVSKPFIRGLGFNRILTLYDGVRQEGQQWGDEHGMEIDENTVGKVEVIKGPASLVYGSDAVAGVINFIPVQPPAPGKITGNILTEYQTNNRLIENAAGIAGHTNDLTWGATFTHKMATNYKNRYDGRVYNTGFAETDAAGYIGINKNWGYSRIGISMFNDLQEIPDGSRDSATRKFTKQITEEDDFRPIVSNQELNSYKISALHQHVQHYRAYATNSVLVGNGRLAFNLAFQRSLRQEYSHPEVAIPGLFLKLNTYSYDVKYYFHESAGLSVTTGINGMLQDNKVDDGTEFIIPSYRQFDAGPFVYVKKTWNKMEIAGGLRYDVRDFRSNTLYAATDPSTGFDHAVTGSDITGADKLFSSSRHTFSGFSGSVGLSYIFNDKWSLKANVGRGFRAPNISEISSDGVHPGTNMYQIGNTDFKPEFNWQGDIGVAFNSTHITINADAFSNHIRNYIYNQKLLSVNGGDSIIIPGNETFQFQAARAHLYGGELSIDIHPHPWDWLHFENSLSAVYAINNGVPGQGKLGDSARYLPFIPPLHTISELRANLRKPARHLANAFVKLQLEVYAAQNRVYLENGTETPTPGYHLWNAGVGSDITGRNGRTVLTVSVMGNNLMDRAYQSGLNRLKYFEDYPGNFTGHDGIYNMGRNFSIRVDVPLNFKG